MHYYPDNHFLHRYPHLLNSNESSTILELAIKLLLRKRVSRVLLIITVPTTKVDSDDCTRIVRGWVNSHYTGTPPSGPVLSAESWDHVTQELAVLVGLGSVYSYFRAMLREGEHNLLAPAMEFQYAKLIFTF